MNSKPLAEYETGHSAVSPPGRPSVVAPAFDGDLLGGPEGQLAAIDRMMFLAEATGLSFLCVEADAGVVLARSDSAIVELVPAEIISQLSGLTGLRLMQLESGLTYYAVPLPSVDDHPAVALGYVFQQPGIRPPEIDSLAVELGWTEHEIDDWCRRQKFCDTGILERLISGVLDAEARQNSLGAELDRLVEQVEHTCHEIGVLHTLTSYLELGRSPLDLAEQCLNGLYELTEAEGSLAIIDGWEGRRHLLVKGHVPLNDAEFQSIINRFATHDWPHPLVRNRMTGTLLGADFPELRNFLLAPISPPGGRSGWVMLCNLPEGRKFGTVESSLVRSVASIMATHHHNQELLAQQEELLLQFIESLVSTLDAKDPYTRGHSERVARIAQRLGQELGLPADDLRDLYQAGLLHDIGKIGISDAVLQKQGELTSEEFEHVKLHPQIGDRILAGNRALQKLRPGVRNHHEEFTGGGYPDRLAGEGIPLMARILAVADAYDAMRSDRPYRKGLSVEKIEEIFRLGAGQQWDAGIIEACFRVWEDVRLIGDEGVFSGS